jgi:hypothetical protein
VAEEASDRLHDLFRSFGNAEERTGVYAIFDTANAALRDLVGDAPRLSQQDWPQARGIFQTVRRAVADLAREGFDEAEQIGNENAAEQVQVYEGRGPDADETDKDPKRTAEALAAILLLLRGQQQAAGALFLANATTDLLLGDASRDGILRAGTLALNLTFWGGLIQQVSFNVAIARRVNELGLQPFLKQAVAVLDNRTTQTCRNVDGQKQPVNEPFQLTGTPRFADEMMEPPFHWYCRTTVAIVRNEDFSELIEDIIQELHQNMIEGRLEERLEAARAR